MGFLPMAPAAFLMAFLAAAPVALAAAWAPLSELRAAALMLAAAPGLTLDGTLTLPALRFWPSWPEAAAPPTAPVAAADCARRLFSCATLEATGSFVPLSHVLNFSVIMERNARLSPYLASSCMGMMPPKMALNTSSMVVSAEPICPTKVVSTLKALTR